MNDVSGYDRKVAVLGECNWTHQQTGWRSCTAALERMLHHPSGVPLITNRVETKLLGSRAFYWRGPWLGFLHLTPSAWAERMFVSNPFWRASLDGCLGLYALSDYVSEFVRQFVAVPVETILHPIEPSESHFDMEAFRANRGRKLLFIGHWMRKVSSFYRLRAVTYEKVLLNCNPRLFYPFETSVRWRLAPLSYRVLPNALGVKVWEYVSNSHYDELLSRNIVFLDFHDSSANCAVLECIVRSTPVLVPKLPALVEYLGAEYPFFFGNLREASDMLLDEEAIAEAHEYLSRLDKRRFNSDSFVQSLTTSTAYRALPIPG